MPVDVEAHAIGIAIDPSATWQDGTEFLRSTCTCGAQSRPVRTAAEAERISSFLHVEPVPPATPSSTRANMVSALAGLAFWLLVAALPVGAMGWAMVTWTSASAGLWFYCSWGFTTVLMGVVLAMNAGGALPGLTYDLIERLPGTRK